MSDSILVSKPNLEFLLKNFKVIINTAIKNNPKVKNLYSSIDKSNLIKLDNTGNSLLSNNSNYKGDISKIPEIDEKLNIIYDNVFKITTIDGKKIINADKYKDIVSKIDTITTTGNGDKFLNNVGEYVEVIKYVPLTSEEEISLVNQIKEELL